MICHCINCWSVFHLGSRIELGAKTDKIVCKHCFFCFLFFFVFCFGSRILKLQRSKQMGSNKY